MQAGYLDHQVKIRGFRIELVEIETVLKQYHEVQEGVVVVREDQPNDKRLIAYIIPKEASLSHNSLQNFLKQKLPYYMLPAAIVSLKS